MGDYTELVLNLQFDIGAAVVPVLEKMTKVGYDVYIADIPASMRDHPFFSTQRWHWCLRSGGAYTATGALPCNFEVGNDLATLVIWTSIKNYTKEWEHLLSWLGPYARGTGYVGYKIFEIHEFPTLLYLSNGKILEKQVLEVSNG